MEAPRSSHWSPWRGRGSGAVESRRPAPPRPPRCTFGGLRWGQRGVLSYSRALSVLGFWPEPGAGNQEAPGSGRAAVGMAGPGWGPPRLDGFILTERLGSGTYATVYKAYAKVGAGRPGASVRGRNRGHENF